MAKKYYYMVVEKTFYNNEQQFDVLNACSRFDDNKIYGSVASALNEVANRIADYMLNYPNADIKPYCGDNSTEYTHLFTQHNYNSDRTRLVLMVKKMTLM